MTIIKATTLFFFIFWTLSASAQSDKEVQAFLGISEKVENIKLESLRDELNVLRQEKRRASKIEDPRSRRDALREIQEKEKLVKSEMRIIRKAGYFPSIFYEGLEVGSLGTMTGDPLFKTTIRRIEVFQIIDDSSMIIKLYLKTRTDDRLHPYVSSTELVYVNDYPTGKLTDEQVLASLRIGEAVPDTVWYVSGNKTYETTNGGSNTVLSINPVQPEQIEKVQEETEQDE